MQIRCACCTKTLALADDGVVPAQCPHCARPPGPGPLGAYEPLRLLACGGMGEVWLARHRDLGTEVAVKLLPAVPLDQIDGLRARFAREARLTARIPHPGAVKVHGFGEAGDRPFLVLEYIAGQTLRQRLQRGPLPIGEAARIAAATADVLAAAHRCGVLHRDVKPDNVMLQPNGEVRVLDFGIARALHDDAPLTRTGELVGTPEYMAPEQLVEGPEATTARTDVHALGVLTCELLTGRSPFHGASVFQALKLVESLEPPPPSRTRPGVPPALDAVVLQAMQKEPERRHESAAAFAAALRNAVPSAKTGAAVDGPATRHLLAPIGAAMLLAAVLWSTFPEPPARNDDPRSAAPVNAGPQLADLERLLRDHEWQRALALAERVDAPEHHRRDLAQAAFTNAYAGFVQATGAPSWLAACDESRRQRWFPDQGEAQASTTKAPTLAVPFGATALEAFAQRVPLASAEHWLAELGANHLRGDRAAGARAAETAWLSGAGEFAVLLDAWLQVAPLPDTSAWRRLAPRELERVRRRVAGGDAKQAPAGVVLLALLDGLHGLPVDTESLTSLPASLRAEAGAWCLAAAGRDPTTASMLQNLANALNGEVRRGG
ncbi:MAG: serine/threonine protein kinase [Planctomycetes bacterium]|nr:serine/threonine protein kinase [Planctomycetota bacterium]